MGSNDDMLIHTTECGFHNNEPTHQRSWLARRWPLVLGCAFVVCGSGIAITSAMTTVKLLPSIGVLNTVRNSLAVVNISAIDVNILQKAQDKTLLEAIYCKGPLLDAIQRSKVFPEDSKHFVDMPIKPTSSPQTILTEFQMVIQPQLTSFHSSQERSLLADFVTKHFDEPGSDIQTTQLSDFLHTPNVPPRIASIQSPAYRDWAVELHKLWNELGRTPDPNVISSYLRPTPVKALGENSKPVIVVPGGRFRESYYWDSYWIVEGLLVSQMHETARQVVNNLLAYVAEHGFVPNGGRIYYLTRSQPPLLSDMVKLVAVNENGEWDMSYLAAALPLLDKEYHYWMTTHTANVTIGSTTHVLNEYTSDIGAPRPESYREDLSHAEGIDDKPMFYNDVIAAAESGWDFSGRWFRDHHSFPTITTMDIIPVDLNAILYRVERNLMEMHRVLDQIESSRHYEEAAQRRLNSIDALLWDEESGSWRDYIKSTSSRSPVVSVANYLPLWANAFDVNDTKRISNVVHSLRVSGLLQVAGVQSTTLETGQQWDAPNAWPPLQDMLIQGLFHAADATESSGNTTARELAHQLIKTWVTTNFAAWNETGLMFEKYNATVLGGLGDGGEYVPQFGFGWTNGVILKFLTQYESILSE